VSGDGVRRLTLYVRQGCHLCEEMWRELQALRSDLAFELETVDLAVSPRLEAAYGDRVPVLEAGGEEICRFFLDPEKLARYLDGP
jgi:hypothetical protein